METEIQTETKPALKSYNPSRAQRGWDKLNSVTRYCIWMLPTEEYNSGVDAILGKLRSDYIMEHDLRAFDLNTYENRSNKWRTMYERQSKNGRVL